MSNDCKNTWIAVDWGTSNLRVWLMSGEEVIEARSSDTGMGSLKPSEFESALLELIDDWLGSDKTQRTPIIACGMVGARQGWMEAQYAVVPCVPLAKFVKPQVIDPRLDVHILSGLSQHQPHDVMRGEETQIAGFLKDNPGYSGLICMPGTHSKWVELKDGEIARFTTMMTGEVYEVLCEHSVLSSLVDKKGYDISAFERGLNHAETAPELILSKIFTVRARAVLEGDDAAATAAYLSGILIGTEIAAMKKQVSFDGIQLFGSGILGELYTRAFEYLGATVENIDVTNLTISGLIEARKTFLKVV